ncbi:response regulator [Desulfobacterales bacterium HSG16]|nr:response regulator [Desulfobacterales bacterium HSG16]
MFNLTNQQNSENQMIGDILIVDDNPENLRILSGMLSKKGYKPRIAIRGTLALQNARLINPDMILLDVKMPDMDGYTVCQQLKADDQTRDIPIIFISALDEVHDKIKAFQSGGVDYITKPFHMKEVLARVETHMNLRTMQKKLGQQNIRLCEEITERKNAEKSLKKAHDELEIRVQERTSELETAKVAAESASRAKTEFLANISHELRTPLTPIIGMTELILSKGDLRSNQEKYLKIVKKSADFLLAMIDDLIELSRMEAEGITLEAKSFSLDSMVKSVFNFLTPRVLTKKLKLTTSIDPDVPHMVIGDPYLLVRILEKIGENGIKFTEKGEINISVAKEPEENNDACSILIRFTITDTGVGIPKDRLKAIFEDFTQADGSNTRVYGGLGLGLTMVRKLLDRMGGGLRIKSEPGSGSSFYFSIRFTLPSEKEKLLLQREQAAYCSTDEYR